MMQGMSPDEKTLLIALADAVLDGVKFILDSPFTPIQAKQTAAKMQKALITAKEKLA